MSSTSTEARRGRRMLTAACALFLFLLNAYIVLRLYFTAFDRHMNSVEGFFIAMARHVRDDWPDIAWWPVWYGGLPFANIYPPGLHLAVAAVAAVFGMNIAHAYHAVTAFFYCIGPLALFWMAYVLSGLRWPSLCAGILFSVFSPSALLMPDIARDIQGIWHARRFQALASYGEGPNVSGLALVMIALALTHVAFTRGGWWRYGLALVGIVAVPLVSWPDSIVLTIALVCYVLSRDSRSWMQIASRLCLIGIAGYAVACPLLPPSAVLTTYRNANVMGGAPHRTPAYYASWILLLATIAILVWLLRRFAVSSHLRFALLFFWIIGWIVLNADWGGPFLIPQPLRFNLAMEIGIVLSAVFGVHALLAGRVPARGVVAIFFILFCARQTIVYRRYAREIVKPVQIQNTIEYRMAKQLEAAAGNGRVLAPGTIKFWMNAFTGAPQLTGCCTQSVINPMEDVAAYVIGTGDGAGTRYTQIALLWLKVFGVRAVAVTKPGSAEPYQEFAHLAQFEGILPVVWRRPHETIYSVPERSDFLAHVMQSSDLPSRTPVNGVDVAPLAAYVAALDDPRYPEAAFTWKNPHTALISARLAKDQVISVQINDHPGWRATQNGRVLPVERDALGMVLLRPNCVGSCAITLTYDGGAEAKLTRVISLFSIVALGCAAALWRKQRRA